MSADISPDCAAGKHHACNGEGWDHDADEVGVCPCDCHGAGLAPTGFAVTVGSRLFGFCNGYFGRDSYEDKTVVASGSRNGTSWMVAEEESAGELVFASGFNPELVRAWAVPS